MKQRLLALLALAVVVLSPSPALADQPQRLATQVVDDAGALGSGRAGAEAALSRLQNETGIQLWVVFVRSFDGIPAQQWTDETAALSDLGDRDALLAVATADRAYAYSFPDDARLSDNELADVAAERIEPALGGNDWAGAVVAGADGYREAVKSSGSAVFVWIAIAFIVVVAAIIWFVARRRRAAAEVAAARTSENWPVTPAGPSLEELDTQANALLLELDDDLRASERELAIATGQYGAAATERFTAALESSRQDVAEAFRLRAELDQEPPPPLAERRKILTRIVELCQGADKRLDDESDAFDELRDLESKAAEVADEADRRRAEVEASLPAAQAALHDLTSRYAGPPVTAVATNVDQARERLAFTASALTRARAALGESPPDNPEAALAVRAAEQAVDQAGQLVAAVHQAVTDLDAARKASDALILEVEAEIAAGRATLASTTPPPADLAEAARSAEQVLIEARAELAGPASDPIGLAARLQAADAALDRSLAEARDTAERAARARSLLAQALPVARSEVAAANSFVTTRRGAVTTSARSTLAEAERHLSLAESLSASDPVTAVTEAQLAQRLATNAGRLARSDVQTYSSSYEPAVAEDDSLLGALLG
ncbi:TPM domain-containing protein, partial [Actinoplanes sp. NPDC051633]|uniref:TPM domain-containing protein n=1 Tax=Actinoplanes sp. NPDC051633 TaxID=3155670 RepID=UPI003447F915